MEDTISTQASLSRTISPKFTPEDTISIQASGPENRDPPHVIHRIHLPRKEPPPGDTSPSIFSARNCLLATAALAVLAASWFSTDSEGNCRLVDKGLSVVSKGLSAASAKGLSVVSKGLSAASSGFGALAVAGIVSRFRKKAPLQLEETPINLPDTDPRSQQQSETARELQERLANLNRILQDLE